MQILVVKKLGVLRMQGPDFSSISNLVRRPKLVPSASGLCAGGSCSLTFS